MTTQETTTGIEEAGEPERSGGLIALFRLRDFRRYWYGAASFGVGIWAYITAMGWTALELTDSAFAVSLVNVVYFMPMFLFAVPAGVVADVVDRRKLAVVSRAVSAVVAGGLGLLAGAGHLTFAWLLVVSFIIGASIVSELSARQAYVAQIVPPSMISNAFALTAFQGGIARVIGPFIAGWAIARWGDAGGYWFFALTNVAFVWFFLRISVSGRPPERPGRARFRNELISGFSYLRHNLDAASVVATSVLCGAVGWVHLAMMPVVARDVLGGDSVVLGTLGMAVGLGSVPSSIYLSTRKRNGGEGKLYVGGLALWATGIAGFGLAQTQEMAVAMLFLSGIGFTAHTVLAQTLIIKLVPIDFHGRVLGLLGLTWGANIVGTLTAGALAETLGVGTVVVASAGVIVLVTATVVGLNRDLVKV
ncbi:MAG: MFS transporter [Actinomycetota bacterium]